MDLFRFREKHTPQVWGHCKGWVSEADRKCGVASFYGWVISYANEWRIILENHPLLRLLTVPGNCPGASVCVIYLADWGWRFSWIWLVLLDPFTFNWFMLCPWAMSFFQKLCPAPFPPVSCSSSEPNPGPQYCLYYLLEGQPENSWTLGGKYCIISNPSTYSGLHLPVSTCATAASLSGPARVGDRHTMPARSPYVGGVPSRAIGLPRIMFVTLGVSPAGRWGPNSCQPSPKVTNIPPDQTSTPLLWNIWSIASYQFVPKPFTNSYNWNPAPL